MRPSYMKALARGEALHSSKHGFQVPPEWPENRAGDLDLQLAGAPRGVRRDSERVRGIRPSFSPKMAVT